MIANVLRLTCTRRIQFCAGHRVLGHEGKCANMHGHNYVAMITAQGPQLDSLGRVIDFSVLKERVGGWIERWWDHGFLFYREDKEVASLFFDGPLQHHKHYALDVNPTAENLCSYLLPAANALLEDTFVEVVSIRLWETENCYATVHAG